jgi:NitT/TauT family transport system permease protein
MPQLFAGVIVLAAVAIAFNEAVRALEARCSTWRT